MTQILQVYTFQDSSECCSGNPSFISRLHHSLDKSKCPYSVPAMDVWKARGWITTNQKPIENSIGYLYANTFIRSDNLTYAPGELASRRLGAVLGFIFQQKLPVFRVNRFLELNSQPYMYREHQDTFFGFPWQVSGVQNSNQKDSVISATTDFSTISEMPQRTFV